MIPFSLEHKNVLITGASSGIGEACSIACSESGADLILLGRDHIKLDKTLEKLNPGNHSILSYDLLNLEGIEDAFKNVLQRYGKIHGFIHSAGIDITRPLNSLRPHDFQEIFSINVASGFEIARLLSKNQYSAEGASYVFISSVMSMVGEPAKIAYSASKGALLSGCRSMALELALKKIRVNCISPAIIQTELVKKLFNDLPEGAVKKIKSQHPLGFGTPVDIANACLYLLSDEARWVTGSNLVIDGGYSCR
jgi:NAD(P)-dependent dehydrogenase (short-subunit alcohol dehydrogenase family)